MSNSMKIINRLREKESVYFYENNGLIKWVRLTDKGQNHEKINDLSGIILYKSFECLCHNSMFEYKKHTIVNNQTLY